MVVIYDVRSYGIALPRALFDIMWLGEKLRQFEVDVTAITLKHWCRRRGCRGCKHTPKSFDLSKIQRKSLKIWAKTLQIRAKMAPDVAWFQKLTHTVCKKHIKTFLFFLEVIPKKGLHDFVGENLWQKYHKSFWGMFEEILAKIFYTPKNLPAPASVRWNQWKSLC